MREVADGAARRGTCAPAPAPADLARPVRVAIDYGDAAELADKADRAAQALETGNPRCGARCGPGACSSAAGRPGKVAFLYTGPGLAVRQHAEEPARAGAGRRRHVRPRRTG